MYTYQYYDVISMLLSSYLITIHLIQKKSWYYTLIKQEEHDKMVKKGN